MKNYGVVSGHTFPRHLLEEFKRDLDKAIEEMNRPDPIKHLARVRNLHNSTIEGVVLVGGYVQQTYAKKLDCPEWKFTVVKASDGGGSTFSTEEELRKFWEVIG